MMHLQQILNSTMSKLQQKHIFEFHIKKVITIPILL